MWRNWNSCTVSKNGIIAIKNIIWQHLKKLKIELLYDPAIPLWYMSKMTENRDSDRYFFTARLFTIAKTWEQSKCPVREKWIFKMWYIHTMEYYPVLEKEGNSDTCYNMDEF